MIFADRSKAMLFLWILFVSHVTCLSLLCCLVCSLQPCGHLLGRTDLLSLLCAVFSLFLSLSHIVSIQIRTKGEVGAVKHV